MTKINTNTTEELMVDLEETLIDIRHTREKIQKELNHHNIKAGIEKNKQDRSNRVTLGCAALAAIALGIYSVTRS